MKKILTVLLVLFLVACGTTGNYKTRLDAMVGMSEAELVSMWGTPDKTYETRDGNKLISYRNEHTNNYYTSTTSDSAAYPDNGLIGGAQDLWCETTFTLNSQGTVIAHNFKGNFCKSR